MEWSTGEFNLGATRGGGLHLRAGKYLRVPTGGTISSPLDLQNRPVSHTEAHTLS